MVNRSLLSIKKTAQYSSQCLTPIINHTAYSRHLSTRYFNGKTRTIIHVSIRPHQNNSKLKQNHLDLNSRYQIKNSKSSQQDINSQFNENLSTQQSFSRINMFTNSNFLQKSDCRSNTKDILEYSKDKKRRKRRIISVRRCLWLLFCLCVALLLGLVITIALIATLIKPNPTTTSETTTGAMSTLTTTTVSTITTTSIIFTSTTTTSTTESTTVTTTESTTGTTAVTISTTTTSAPPTVSVNVLSSTSNFFGYELINISCSVPLTNVTIQIFVQTTSGATFNAMSNSFSTGVVTQSDSTTASQIIYTWTIVSGQTVACVSATYDVKAQFSLSGTAQVTSADTYIITTTTSGGVTTVFTGHF